ncbi:hypothetical protein GCM10023184_01640 [Flaviaesturariibacter amylovorans]|uniref:Uncharacterized protein n=2 Tax=Flaviaesturariibacter amylovorans TaxID=1084520 RepID=A0ABP8G5B0_9BACT
MRSLLGLLLIAGVYSCQKEISVESGASAAFALQDEFGDCLGDTVAGSYYAGRALGDTNYLDLRVRVLTTGRYAINTDVQNGFSFRATGNFADTGLTTVRLRGTGTPTAEQVTTLRISRDSGYCDIVVNVLPNPGGPGGGPGGGGACNAQSAGSYQKDTALTAANTVTVQHSFASTGNFTVYTDTVNGYWFRKDVTVTAAGQPQTIVLAGSGTPAAIGTNTFNVRFGDTTTCTFSVTVTGNTSQPTNDTYFPMGQGSYWTYSDPERAAASDPDTVRTVVSGTSTIGGQTYNRFITSDDGGARDTAYYRKDAAGTFYGVADVADLATALGFTFPVGSFEAPFLKESLTTGATWVSSTVNGTSSGLPTALRLTFKCTNNNATVTVNGRTFNNVYVIENNFELSVMGAPFFAPFPATITYFAKNVGLIKDVSTGYEPQELRFYQIN